MKVPKDWLKDLTDNIKEGRVPHADGSIQIPDMDIELINGRPSWVEIPSAEFPDEWFLKMKEGYRIAVGKESYFIFLSRQGFKTHEEKLKAAFDASGSKISWDAFCAQCERFWVNVARAKLKRAETLRAQLKELGYWPI